MSGDSSSVATVQRQPFAGWKAAVSALGATGLIYVVAPLVAAVMVVIVPLLQGQPAGKVESWLANSVIAQFFYILLAETATIAAILGLLKLFRWNWRSIGLSKPRWYHPLLGIAAVVPYFIFYLAMAKAVSALVPGFDVNQKQEIGFDTVQGTTQLVLTFISLVILPPLAEEITMRGFLYTGLRKWLPRILAALVVSALFGAAHLSQGGAAGPLWIGALDTCILSLILIALRELTGNLWAGISLHMTKNFVAFLALYIFAVT
jgi:membrane protease YdiL (CAAX protease family)